MKKHRSLLMIVSLLGLVLLAAQSMQSQGKTVMPDLSDIVKAKGWKLFNREASVVEDGGRRGIRFDEKAGIGLAWLEGSNFDEGTIEVDLRGRNVAQKSFVGVAFRGVDQSTHDAIYFRPFNFKTEDSVCRVHAVQYVSHPDFPWERLRQERNGVYEKAVNAALDPDAWFHARIVIARRKISVFVNNEKEPSLQVDELTDRKGGLIGLWVGDGSDGMFANLKITAAK
jgi:Domain of Unknown Function (DUF1080)